MTIVRSERGASVSMTRFYKVVERIITKGYEKDKLHLHENSYLRASTQLCDVDDSAAVVGVRATRVSSVKKREEFRAQFRFQFTFQCRFGAHLYLCVRARVCFGSTETNAVARAHRDRERSGANNKLRSNLRFR